MSRRKRELHERIAVGGVRTADRDVWPDEYAAARVGPDVEFRSFEKAVNYLTRMYNIERVPLLYADSAAAEFETAKHWRALVNPAWMSDGVSDPPVGKDDPIWHVVTDEYTPAGPDDIWEPLLTAVDDVGLDAFGEIRLRRWGGDQHIDLFFPSKTVEYGEGEDATEHVLGLSAEHDYFGGRAQQVSIIALDATGERMTVLRQLTDPKKRKHTGSAPSDVAAWWSAVIDQVDTVAEVMYGAVADSMAYTVDFRALPCTVPEFYEALGLPNGPRASLADDAARAAISTVGEGGYDAYHLYRAGMAAIDDRYDARNTRAYTKHVATVNRLVLNPVGAEQGVIKGLRDEVDEKQTRLIEGDEAVPEDWDELETMESALDSRAETIGEGYSEYETARQRLRTMLDEAEPETEDGAA